MQETEAKNLGGKGEARTLLKSYRGMLISWKDINKGNLIKKKEKYTKLEREYNIGEKGEKVVIDEL